MIEVYDNTKIFIACPANAATGGPELLHQLGYHLINDLNIETYMFYYDFNSSKFKKPVHPEYEMYRVPYVLEIQENEDVENNVLIVPEVFSTLSLLPLYNNIRKGCWFLSVDNYYFSKPHDFFVRFDIYLEGYLNVLATKYDYRYDKLLKLANFYMTNSYRGLEWFKELNPMYYIPDYYVNIEFIKESQNIILSQKQNIVVYNPKKGISFTRKIISSAKEINFVPIINMSRKDVINLLKQSKVYIDFGHFPGPERIPKEAAILGCCVITGKRGSAAFFEDVPIPDEYKFDDKEENIPKIIEKIKDCFENFEERYKDFDYYRQVIKKEPEKFIEDMKNIFVKV